MIGIEKIVIVCFVISFVNGHGYLEDPPGRVPSTKIREAEFSGALIYQYYYRGWLFCCLFKLAFTLFKS